MMVVRNVMYDEICMMMLSMTDMMMIKYTDTNLKLNRVLMLFNLHRKTESNFSQKIS